MDKNQYTQLKRGAEIELEHSKSLVKFLKKGVNIKEVAKAIAKDHLREDKNYYKKLKLIEPGLKDKPNLAVEKTRPPYNDKGKTNFNLRNRPGTYIIYENKKIVYIGFSHKDVYKALYRHFQQWKDKTQQRIVFDDLKGITVRVIYCISGAKARSLEGALIIKHRPELNINKYEGFITDEKEKALLHELETTPPVFYEFEGDLPF